ncbi:MAG TPA: NAD(P)-dependent oxidoreductase, partial [Dehalococcoidia bacterium]|nr:NAD(P)-dependent oxidoreductase [Dehalococcoidia bacterium]
WRSFEATTVRGTENVVRAAEEARVPRLIHFSSVAVYDDRALAAGPVKETSRLTDGRWTGAFGFYGRSKVLAERAARRHHSKSGLRVTVLRPAWVYGPRDSTILPYLRVYLRTPFAPWLGQSDPLMPLVHVSDVVEAALLASEAEASAGQTYNIAGPGYPLRDFLWTLCDGLGGRMPNLRVPRRLALAAALAIEMWSLPLSPWLASPLTPSAVTLLERGVQVDCSKARRELGWLPRVSIDEGMEATLQWLRAEGRQGRPVSA